MAESCGFDIRFQTSRGSGVVGVDLGNSWCGVAWRDTEGKVRSRAIRGVAKKDASTMDRARHVDLLSSAIVGVVANLAPGLVVIEAYAYRMVAGSHAIVELGGVVRVDLVRHGFEIAVAEPAAARAIVFCDEKAAGKWRKEEVTEAGLRRWPGIYQRPGDEIDAIVLLHVGEAMLLQQGIMATGSAGWILQDMPESRRKMLANLRERNGWST